MKLIHPKYRDRQTGQYRETERWYVRIMIRGVERRIPGFTDRRSTEELGRRVERLAVLRQSGEALDPTLSRWLETISSELQDSLVKWGLLAGATLASKRPLQEHLDAYVQAIRDAGNTGEYVDKTTFRIKAVLGGLIATHLSDVTPEAVSHYLAKRRALARGDGGLSIKSSNHYLAAIKGFCGWMVDADRARRNPLATLAKLNASTDRRHVRRALEAEEIRRLLSATRQSTEPFEDMMPEDRYWLYRLAAETGLRSAELRSLTRSSFDLEGSEASVSVDAKDAKNRKAATIPLRPTTAAGLQAYLGGKVPASGAFNMPRPEKVVVMLRKDLGAAGIRYADDAGRVADFHSLRKSFATMLLRSGVDVRTAKDLMRHSTVALTADVYAVSVRGSQSEAVAGLPDLSVDAADVAKEGTTCGENSPVCLPDSLPDSLPKSRANKCHVVRPMTTAARPASESMMPVKARQHGSLCRHTSSSVVVDSDISDTPPRGFEPLSPA